MRVRLSLTLPADNQCCGQRARLGNPGKPEPFVDPLSAGFLCLLLGAGLKSWSPCLAWPAPRAGHRAPRRANRVNADTSRRRCRVHLWLARVLAPAPVAALRAARMRIATALLVAGASFVGPRGLSHRGPCVRLARRGSGRRRWGRRGSIAAAFRAVGIGALAWRVLAMLATRMTPWTPDFLEHLDSA